MALPQKSKIPPTEAGGTVQILSNQDVVDKGSNPTHGSEWIVQIVSTKQRAQKPQDFPLHSSGRKDLNYPQTAVCGISASQQPQFGRKDLKVPPTYVGGISHF
jgi:hypothetical protein